MTRSREKLTVSDPVSISKLEELSSAPVFDELFEAIVTASEDASGAVPGSRREIAGPVHAGPRKWFENRRFVVAVVSSVAAVVLLVTLVAVPGLRAPGRTHRAVRAGRQAGAALVWRLVGDISPSWRIQPSEGFQPGFSLTCPTVTTCYADSFEGTPGAEPEVEVTNDAGQNWQQSDLPVALSDITRVACLNAETCALFGIDSSGNATFLGTTDGGQTWTSTPGPSEVTSTAGVFDLSCTTAASCALVVSDPSGETGTAVAYSTNDAGRTWNESNLPMDFVPGALQCVAPSTCVTVGFLQSPAGSPSSPPAMVLYSSDGGSTWTTSSLPSLPSTPGALSRLTCSDASDCMASFFEKPGLTSTVLVSDNGGQSWSQSGSSPPGFVSGLSCPTASDCWTSGIVAPNNAGQPVLVARAGGFISSTTDGGGTWQSAQLPDGIGPVVDISCPSDSTCYAIAVEPPTEPWQPIRTFTAVFLAYGG
jgi:photosystem II stability/assembly factor-like uncharacterized protein